MYNQNILTGLKYLIDYNQGSQTAAREPHANIF